MSPSAHCQPVLLNTASPDHQGCLLFVDERLVAVVTRLKEGEGRQPEHRGRWFLEAGFGPCQRGADAPCFASCDEALSWARQQVEQRVRKALLQ
ncbi:conserved hypothetical protein [Methylobacterium sp. 4-46]|nr:conserved hypothetical protein [Methylobacterium sp. 4-46]